jgi:putative transposase
VQVIKNVVQRYEPTLEILELLDIFRLMVNDCVRIGLEEGVTSLKSLSKMTYHALDRYSILSGYKLTAISRAVGILKNYRKSLRKHPTKIPYCVKPTLVDYYVRKIVNNKLRLSLFPKNYIYIPLNRHTLSVISGHTLRSITLTTCTISVCYSKEVMEMEPSGLVGIDRNLNNITIATNTGESRTFDLSEATRIKATYREVKSHFRRNDDRIKRKIFGKYGIKQRNRVKQIIHKTTKSVIEDAKAKNFGIVMEKLMGIRKLYRSGNGQGNEYRFKLNSWSFYEAQRQFEYKAHWEGLKVIYVNPSRTSSHCAVCGSKHESTERMMYCPECKNTIDRDVNASRNIVQRGMRFVPVGASGEAVNQLKDGKSMTLSQICKNLTEPKKDYK